MVALFLFLSEIDRVLFGNPTAKMTAQRIELIDNYRLKAKSANKELAKKEAFKDLLNMLYAGNKEIERIIDKITFGSESTVLNIPRKDKLHRGSADTLYNKIIIEFEKDLKVSFNHAKEQLTGYLLDSKQKHSSN